MASANYSNSAWQAKVVKFLEVLLCCPLLLFCGASETLFCLFSWLSSEGGDGDTAVAVLQMKGGGKEELQVDFFQVVSLKCVGPGLSFPQMLVFIVKHISVNVMHSYCWHIFSCESLPAVC